LGPGSALVARDGVIPSLKGGGAQKPERPVAHGPGLGERPDAGCFSTNQHRAARFRLGLVHGPVSDDSLQKALLAAFVHTPRRARPSR